MSPTPEQLARVEIDRALAAAGWLVQDRDAMNLAAGPGVAVREFPMASGHGFADYLLFVKGKAAGVTASALHPRVCRRQTPIGRRRTSWERPSHARQVKRSRRPPAPITGPPLLRRHHIQRVPE